MSHSPKVVNPRPSGVGLATDKPTRAKTIATWKKKNTFLYYLIYKIWVFEEFPFI